MKVIVVNHMRSGMIVHKPGCADLLKSIKRGETNSHWPVVVPDGTDVAEAVAADLSAGFGWPDNYEDGEPAPWSASDVKVLPCVKTHAALLADALRHCTGAVSVTVTDDGDAATSK